MIYNDATSHIRELKRGVESSSTDVIEVDVDGPMPLELLARVRLLVVENCIRVQLLDVFHFGLVPY